MQSSTHYNFTESTPEIDGRVEQLLQQMTVAEKIGQMNQLFIETEGVTSFDACRKELLETHAGSVLTVYGAEIYNKLQKIAIEETRLGIPLLVGNDVIHGYRTIFPIPLAESCSWDLPLMEETARIAAEEASSEGTNWIFAPMIDIGRDPRWGRVAEGAGEDHYLGSEIGKARIRGTQSTQLSTGRAIVACPKHFAGYGFAEGGKDYNTTDMSERVLRNQIFPPFEAAIEAGAGTFMSSFNEIGGVPSSMNRWLLTDVLRDEWGYNGILLSDWKAVDELINHGVAVDLKQAAELSANAGTDIDMVSYSFHRYLAELIEEGKVSIELVDEAVRRVLRMKFMLGLFENPYVDESIPEQLILQESYREVALEMTEKSCVLLKNEENILPLDPATKSIALIGPLADDHHEILGMWHRIGRDEDCESVLDGMKAVFSASEILHHAGCSLLGEEAQIAEAVAVAMQADVVVLVLGESELQSGEAHSRSILGLPGKQQALLEAISETGKPIVLVTMSGRPLCLPWASEHVSTILHAWHGGIRTGQAVANLLSGAVSPTGKLTMSWPRNEGQIPVYYNHKNSGRPPRNEGQFQFGQAHFCNYLDVDDRAEYVFGYGLSYTSFAYSQTTVDTAEIGIDGVVNVSAEITNTGDRDMEEIVQLYIRDEVGTITRPVRELKGFQRLLIPAGETVTVTFALEASALAFYGYDLVKKVEPGRFDVWIAPDSLEEHTELATIFHVV